MKNLFLASRQVQNSAISTNHFCQSIFTIFLLTLFFTTQSFAQSCSNFNGSGSFGILTSGASNNTISCNTTNYTNIGMHFTGACDNTLLRGNNFKQADYGLVLDNNAVIGQQSHHGNLFIGPFSSNNQEGALHFSNDPFIINQSLFFVDKNQNNQYWPFPNGTPSQNPDWFNNQPSASTWMCGNTNTCPNGIGPMMMMSPSNNALAFHALKTASNEGSFSKTQTYTMRQHAFERLIAEGNSPADISGLMPENERGSIAQFYDLKNKFKDVLTREKEQAEPIRANGKRIGLITREMANLDQNAPQGNREEMRAKMQERRRIGQDLPRLHQDKSRQSENLARWKKQQVEILKAQNERIAVTTVVEINQKEVNRILLSTYALGIMDLTSPQINTLERIANQCPTEGGDAVFEARSLLSAVVDRQYDDNVLCRQGQVGLGGVPVENSTINSELSDTNTFLLSPNPVKDVLTFNLPSEGFSTLILMNSFGQMVYQKTIENQKQVKIDVSQFPIGIYHAVLKSKGKPSISQKFSVSN